MVSALPYSRLFSFGGNFRIFRNVERHYENLRYRNTFNVTILSYTNSKFIRNVHQQLPAVRYFLEIL